ncbi:MAG: endonuclease Q family protein, partial [Candidatus Omnitrophica bacterium]|nr:endonuclease Q family protein [Candidatus Omnitrophota bacterium]
LISNSDSHSPQKIGREANVFDTDLTYDAIMQALRTRDKRKFLSTLEFFPEEGKYHYDGHRGCRVSCTPEQTQAYGGICPNCGKPLTIGVMSRVAALADRPVGFVPAGAIPYKNLIPLDEIIADVFAVQAGARRVWREYDKIVQTFGTELAILQDVPENSLRKALLPELTESIMRMRRGEVALIAGYDGEYGRVSTARRTDAPPAMHGRQFQFF